MKFFWSGRSRKDRIVILQFGAACFAAALLPPVWLAQETPPAAEHTLRATTQVVNVYAVVRDKRRPVLGLSREDFEIKEDGVPQEIRYFSRETDTPLTLGILIDTSVSQGRVLGIEQQEAKAFIDQVITKRDLAFVLRFDVDVELLQDLTANHSLLGRAVDGTVINSGGGGVMPGPFPTRGRTGTRLHDAVYLAAQELLKNEVGRKVLIVLSDGEDAGSDKTLDDALQAAEKSDVIIYAIAVVDRHFYDGQFFGGESALERYSRQTGGRLIEVGRAENTAEAFREVAEELRTQYSLGYTPNNTRRDGTYRRVEVKLPGKKYKIQARRGYYAPTE